MTFLQGDLLAPLPPGGLFDVVVSNPPYIAQSEFAELAPEVRDHEPRLALDGGPDGLAYYRRIAAGVGAFLKPGGSLLLEIGWKQADAVRAILAERPELELGPTLKDAGKNPRRRHREAEVSEAAEQPHENAEERHDQRKQKHVFETAFCLCRVFSSAFSCGCSFTYRRLTSEGSACRGG